MTVGVLVKVSDGMVLAADSATTLELANGSHQVWNHADKIFQLHRHKPLAAMTWGSGSVGYGSISTTIKELRRRLAGRDPSADWSLADTYTVEEVANRLIDYVYDEVYVPFFTANPALAGGVGFLVAGFSHDATDGEAWEVIMDSPSIRPDAVQVAAPNIVGWNAWAQPESTLRLFDGHDPRLPSALKSMLEPSEWDKIKSVFENKVFNTAPAHASMPLPDAIQLAKFLADVTIGYSHYTLGPDTVGGAVEIVSINRHEGFRWINRKHYYDPRLNPEAPHEHF